MATQAERVAKLEGQVLTLQESVIALQDALDSALKALALRVNEAHGRIDHAGRLFKQIAQPLTPKREPAQRVPAAEFMAALLELRGGNAHSMERFPRDVIVAKALERRARMQQPA